MAKKNKKYKKAQCKDCAGLCCRYVALPLDTPKTRGDYDDIRWFLTHKGVTVFVENRTWYFSVDNNCRHLSPKDHTCKIYETRPRICRGYKNVDCELSKDAYDYDLYFMNDRQMENYMKVKFDNNSIDRLAKVRKYKKNSK
jgi:Fe-S-cluster containining protein